MRSSGKALLLASLALPLMGEPSCEPVAPGQPIRGYAVLGNGWNAAEASTAEIQHVVEHFDLLQEHRPESARELIRSGARGVLKYRLGIGAWPSSGAPEDIEIFAKVTGEAPGYDVDLRMPAAEGGVMVHDFGFHLVDVVTPRNRAIFRRILRESLEPYLTGPDAFHGVFLDVAGPHNPAFFDGRTPAPPGGYSRAAELAGWIEVYAGLQEDFPGQQVVLNAHHPWEPRDPLDLSGLHLATESGVGMMSESRMMTFGTISGWTDETIHDVGALLATGAPVIVTHSFPEGSTSLPEQRAWGLATYLLAAGDAPNAFYGMDGVVAADELADFPEMRFEGLGGAIGDLVEHADGRILERRFERGRVVAHVKVGFPDATFEVPAGMERLVLVGGGPYPSGGSLAWQPIAAGPRLLRAPARTMPAGSALILRVAP